MVKTLLMLMATVAATAYLRSTGMEPVGAILFGACAGMTFRMLMN